MKRVNECITLIDSDEEDTSNKKPRLIVAVEKARGSFDSTDEEEEEESTVSEIDEDEELSESQQRALDCVLNGENVFITGEAGTGKSFLIETIKFRLSQEGKSFYTTAPTGSAAHNIGGTTIHYYGGIGIGDKDLADSLKFMTREKSERWKSTDVLIIDEASMLEPGFFEKLNDVAKWKRGRLHLPFGGIQLILIGDFFQLSSIPPKNNNKNEIKYKHIFETETWKSLELTMIQLLHNFRQDGEEKYKTLLGAVRSGIITPKEEALLAERDITHNKKLIVPKDATKLFARRADVQRVNTEALAKIKNPSFFYNAEIYQCPALAEKNKAAAAATAFNTDSKYPVDPRIELKVGASVLLCCNMDVSEGLYNGSRGVITKFIDINPKESDLEEENKDKGEEKKKPPPPAFFPQVLFSNGEKRLILPHTWSQTEKKEVISSFKQIPLIPSYALSIHKSQGLTLASGVVEMDFFCQGQSYVALSRFGQLEDMFLSNFVANKQKVIKQMAVDPLVVSFYKKNNLMC